MISTSNRLKIKEIIDRISQGKSVNLSERIYIQKFADRDQTISAWLNKARRNQQFSNDKKQKDSIDQFINDLNIGNPDPHSHYSPEDDDLGEWFKGAPSWLGRS